MRILIVHNRYRSSSPSGENRVVDQEREMLRDGGHEIGSFERHSDTISELSVLRKALLPAGVIWSPGPARDLLAVLDSYRPDVVHVHNLFPMLSPSILHACRRRGVPCVVTLHNFEIVCAAGSLFRNGSVCHDCVNRRVPIPGVVHGCYRGSSLATMPKSASIVVHRRLWQTIPSAYVFLSEAQRREVMPAGLPQRRTFVKPNVVPAVEQRTAHDGLIVFLGRLTEEKGLRVLMDAWDRYTTRNPRPNLRLAIGGTGPLETEVTAWARPRAEVEVLGLLDRTGCTDLVARASAVVVPSEWPEPFGLVVIEAMAAGVPPIATSHGAFPEFITDGQNGLLYPPGDVFGLSEILGKIDEDPGWTDNMGKAALDTYKLKFDPSHNLVELERIYQFAIDNPR